MKWSRLDSFFFGAWSALVIVIIPVAMAAGDTRTPGPESTACILTAAVVLVLWGIISAFRLAYHQGRKDQIRAWKP
jgi:hypothetical protein